MAAGSPKQAGPRHSSLRHSSKKPLRHTSLLDEWESCLLPKEICTVSDTYPQARTHAYTYHRATHTYTSLHTHTMFQEETQREWTAHTRTHPELARVLIQYEVNSCSTTRPSVPSHGWNQQQSHHHTLVTTDSGTHHPASKQTESPPRRARASRLPGSSTQPAFSVVIGLTNCGPDTPPLSHRRVFAPPPLLFSVMANPYFYAIPKESGSYVDWFAKRG